ncbi:UNVERIFIED_ORG: ubiquinone/menaquinone biosynthesis C-methylase UbiE [Burkholderia contaminans]|nr:ubiquinone/menaquinone biosynthesis C-methylase UbiE [Burkholderia contaminans]
MDKLELSPEDVKRLSYNELIGIVKETNRPPGGRATVIEVAQQAFLTADSHVLDIGCSTGYTSIELARSTPADITGIDINPISIGEAENRRQRLELVNARFKVADATALPFEASVFDLVFCGNVTSLINDGERALSEYLRVMKSSGYLAAVPMYYIDPPANDLVRDVRAAIQVNIPVKYRTEAVEFFARPALELVHQSHWRFARKTDEEIDHFCREILSRPHVAAFPADVREAVVDTYTRFMHLFNLNLSHMGYTVMLLRKASLVDEGELFNGIPFAE